jgi:hypothetical protein
MEAALPLQANRTQQTRSLFEAFELLLKRIAPVNGTTGQTHGRKTHAAEPNRLVKSWLLVDLTAMVAGERLDHGDVAEEIGDFGVAESP